LTVWVYGNVAIQSGREPVVMVSKEGGGVDGEVSEDPPHPADKSSNNHAVTIKLWEFVIFAVF